MPRNLHILVGTKKGVFIFDGDRDGGDWSVRGPFCEAWPINHVIGDPATGAVYAGGGNEWFGPAVWKTTDLGETWTHSSEGLAYSEGETPVNCVWSLNASHGRLLAGVQPAGLFRSDDGGEEWTHLDGLQNHPSRPEWMPGGAGLILHHIVPHPDDADEMWIGISAVGVFHTNDGGASWTTRNRGTRQDYAPDDQRYPEFGQCVHSLSMAAGMPNRLYQQNHCGMYVSENGGEEWECIEEGLPSTFGFPAIAHPRDPDTLFLLPLNGDAIGRFMPDGKAAVWRTRDRGRNWQDLRNGLPQEGAYFGVLRQAMATDGLEPAGLYFGTSSGSLYVSADEGDHWTRIAEHLPVITSVETFVTDA
ncbi:exo-alpha-sialidase [Nitratireductor sp. XY-223]|uniref:WD40/YVTN/BNR-like repeat-containing protein n=1 Tax=Nitratireductor sp. XY-223 TaxID=2561926 RepID=UPI0010A9D408|nr:exo-alpha-sialidase [Nitratireductor sp. XY-223]